MVHVKCSAQKHLPHVGLGGHHVLLSLGTAVSFSLQTVSVNSHTYLLRAISRWWPQSLSPPDLWVLVSGPQKGM